MSPDVCSVILRSASLVALFQAAGMALFVALIGRPLDASLAGIQRIGRLSAIAAAALLLGHYALEAARMADDMSGIVDSSMQAMVMNSASSTVLTVRILALIIIAITMGRRDDIGRAGSALGAALVATSFILTGHTLVNPLRLALAPLLLIHVTIVRFWFGALVPLNLAASRETPAVTGEVIETFSRIAGRLVPAILAAGLFMALVLVRHFEDLSRAYGELLIFKIGGFAVLMAIASLNKWRLGPAIASGKAESLRSFRRALRAEYLLISAVLGATAAMTTFYSPEP